MSECYKTSNNKYSDCPPRMSDGRHFTDYRPSNQLELLLASDNNIQSSHQYRNFLQKNGNVIMNKNREVAVNLNGCSNCSNSNRGVEGFDNGTMLPEKYIQTCGPNGCNTKLNDENGIGLGRNYYPNLEQGNLPTQEKSYTDNDCMGNGEHYAKYGNMDPMRNSCPLGGNLSEHHMMKHN